MNIHCVVNDQMTPVYKDNGLYEMIRYIHYLREIDCRATIFVLGISEIQ